MPILRQRRDGNYIIRGVIPGVGRFCTWQVTPEGVALLRQIGITAGGEIRVEMLRKLRDGGLVYTSGSGLGVETVAAKERRLAPSPDPLPLLLSEDEDGWHLQLVLPALPKSFFASAGVGQAVLDTLGHCGLRVDRDQVVPGWRLWPGKGDAACQVAPHEDPYTVEPVGPWPPEWDLSAWTRGADGLRSTGTLFSGPELGSLRLRAGEPTVPGASYYPVAIDDRGQPLSRSTVLPIPTDLNPRELPPRGGWRAWEVRIPSAVNERVREWCLRVSHPLAEPAWRLDLVSPPPRRYSASGLPVVEVGHEVVIAAHPPSPLTGPAESVELVVESEGSALARLPIRSAGFPPPPHSAFKAERSRDDSSDWRGGPVYFAWPVTQEGVYRLRAASGCVTPLTFAAVSAEPGSEPPDLTAGPAQLEVILVNGSSELRLRAFIDGSGPHEISLSPLGGGTTPEIAVRCPAPVDMSWWCGQIRGRRECMQPEEVQDLVAPDLTAASVGGRVFRLQIDAGNFGMLRIHLLPGRLAESKTAVHTGAPATVSLSPRAARRARWLAQAVPALLERGDMATAPLPRDIRAALARLDGLQEGLTLGFITAAPRVLLPHLKALAQALDEPTPRPPARGTRRA